MHETRTTPHEVVPMNGKYRVYPVGHREAHQLARICTTLEEAEAAARELSQPRRVLFGVRIPGPALLSP